jgi:large subunit ribosomal protein L29
MKASELRDKDDAALGRELTDLLKAQFGLRMQIATQQVSNTSQLKKMRRDIARVRTIMTEKSGATSGAATTAPAASAVQETKPSKGKKAGKQ